MHDDRTAAPPYDREAELSVVGAAVFAPEAADIMLQMLAPGDFYFDLCREVYHAVSVMRQDSLPIDAVTLAEQLIRHGVYEKIGGQQAVVSILEAVPHAQHVRHYAEAVLERSKRRKILLAAQQAIRQAYDLTSDPQDLVGNLARQLDDIQGTGTGDVRTASQVLTSLRERNLRATDPIPTGIPDVDAALRGGYRPNQLAVVAARPGMGKTAYALGVAEGAAQAGNHVLLFSLEMDAEEIMDRVQQTDPHRAARLAALPICFDDETFDVEQIASVVRRCSVRYQTRLVVIDYLSLIETSDRKLQTSDRIEKITRALKRLARQQGLAILLLAQLNRDLEKRDDKRPKLSDLRSSGAIEQDADIVQFLYRPELYSPDDRPGEAEIIIAKQRAFRTSTVTVGYVAEKTMFVPYSDRQIEVPDLTFTGERKVF